MSFFGSNSSKIALLVLNAIGYSLLLYWATDNIDSERLAAHFAAIPAAGILTSLAIYLTTLALYGMRMALLLKAGFLASFSIVNLGYTLNALIPLRLGEGFKIVLGHRLYGFPLTALFSASVAEKLADILKLLLLGIFVVTLAAGPVVFESILIPVMLASLLAIGTIALARKYVIVLIRFLPKRSGLRRAYIELHKHSGDYPLGLVIALTIAIGGTNIALIFIAVNGYLPGVTFSVIDAITLFLVLAFAVALPSAPAGLGLFEGGAVVYLTQKIGASADAALAVATVLHLVIILPPLIFTVVHLLYRQVTALLQGGNDG